MHFRCRLKSVKEHADGDQFYKIYAQVLDASCYGVPQSRKRLFIVALRKKKIRTRFQWPTPMGKQVPFQSVLLPTKGGGRILGTNKFVNINMNKPTDCSFLGGQGQQVENHNFNVWIGHFSPRTIEPTFQTDVATWFETGSKSRW